MFFHELDGFDEGQGFLGLCDVCEEQGDAAEEEGVCVFADVFTGVDGGVYDFVEGWVVGALGLDAFFDRCQ